MATAREFLDFVTNLFATDAKMENVVRTLQQDNRIAIGGRGRSAHQISTKEAALILIAYAASLKAVDAARRLKKVERLRSQSRGFYQAVCAILNGKLKAEELRISRTQAYAEIRHPDGTVEVFAQHERDLAGRFRIEAILDRQLLSAVARFLATNDVRR